MCFWKWNCSLQSYDRNNNVEQVTIAKDTIVLKEEDGGKVNVTVVVNAHRLETKAQVRVNRRTE